MPQISNMLKILPLNPIRFLTPIIEKREKEGVHFYKLNIGQPDLEIDPYIEKAIHQCCSAQVYKHIEYTNSQGLIEIRKAWSEGYYEGFFDPDQVLITNGSSEGMMLSYLGLLNPDETNLTFAPIYPNYDAYAHITGRKVISINRKSNNGYKMPTKDEIEEVLKNDKSIKMITIISPDNPTGYVMNEDEIEAIFYLAEKYDLWVVVDEAYRDIRFERASTVASDYLKKHTKYVDRCIFLATISKEFSGCGIRIGAMISRNTEIIKEMTRLVMPRLSVSEISQKICIDALYSPREMRLKVMETYRERRDVVIEELSNIGLQVVEPQGALYVLPDLSFVGINDSLKFSKWLVEEFTCNNFGRNESVVVTPGNGFFTQNDPNASKSLIRIAYVIGGDELRKAIQILGIGIKKYVNNF